MHALDPRSRAVAIGLASMAGMVDAIGFMASGGFFLSFMSGNSTRLAVGIYDIAPYVAMVAALLSSFVGGVTIGSLIGRRNGHRPETRRVMILFLMAGLLFLAPLLGGRGLLLPALCMAAFCMGAENTLFERDGTVSFGLTYMTGALVKIGQGVATMLNGGERLAWLPFLLLWIGLLTGAIIGAASFAGLGLFALWIPAAMALIFGGMTWLWAS